MDDEEILFTMFLIGPEPANVDELLADMEKVAELLGKWGKFVVPEFLAEEP